jgi:hypothetical protein
MSGTFDPDDRRRKMKIRNAANLKYYKNLIHTSGSPYFLNYPAMDKDFLNRAAYFGQKVSSETGLRGLASFQSSRL